MAGRWHGKALQPAELAIILEQRALGHGKELIKRALAREGYQRSTESIRGHLDAIKRREVEEQSSNPSNRSNQMSATTEQHMSNEQKLPYDVARCSGVRVATLCHNCLRKTAPGRPDGPQVYISPQVFDAEIGIEQCRNHISATGATHE